MNLVEIISDQVHLPLRIKRYARPLGPYVDFGAERNGPMDRMLLLSLICAIGLS